MTTGKQEGTRYELLSVRFRQRQLGRGLRLMYERFLREPVPHDMIDVLRAAEEAGSTDESHRRDTGSRN